MKAARWKEREWLQICG